MLALSMLLAVTPVSDGYGLGDGGRALVVSGPMVLDTARSRLSAAAASGATTLTVERSDAFRSGALVLIHQVVGVSSNVIGERAFTLEEQADGGGVAGTFELRRLKAVSPGTLSLDRPLTRAFGAGVSQVVAVEELDSLTVMPGATLSAPAWDGETGGVLALFVKGQVTNDGQISADARGLRAPPQDNPVGGGGANCTGSGSVVPPMIGLNGEGLVEGAFASRLARHGNTSIGGGAGICSAGGGGGGSHRGGGGSGGLQFTVSGSPPYRGARASGGERLSYEPLGFIVFGGGGGGAHSAQEVPSEVPGSPGAGGGVIVIRAAAYGGAGSLSARGGDGVAATRSGGGGGGGGGTLSLRLASASCPALLSVAGGRGAHTFGDGGTRAQAPGGGGGAGLVLLQTGATGCTPGAWADEGLAGRVLGGGRCDDAGVRCGATPTSMGECIDVEVDGGCLTGRGDVVIITEPFAPPAPPVIETPEEGEKRPSPGVAITGRVEREGTAVLLRVGGRVLARADSVDAGFRFENPVETSQIGDHEVEVVAERFGIESAPATRRFRIGPASLYGCGCGSSPGALLAALLLLAHKTARRPPTNKR